MPDHYLNISTENREHESGSETLDLGQETGSADSRKLPERISRYRVERLLGEGGFGLVFLAYDEKLHRNVAVKVPHAQLVSSPEDAELYLTEARTVANLDHPNIVPVYDVGSTDEFPCFVVSKFIDGQTLAAEFRRKRANYRQAAELIATIAEALHYAHKEGLVHRDVKPGNIMVDQAGKPFVVDFGLALREEDVGKGPRYAGTPAYMSPEQAWGEGHRVDGRTDIFSLGVVLYELLIGRLPFDGRTREELMENITSQEARPPRQHDETIPRELDRICLKALAKRASERYSTARDMAEDLRHFLAEQAESCLATPATQIHNRPALGPGDFTSSLPGAVKIVPKGLRSFDEHDADFFLELLPGPRDRDGLPDSLRFWKTWIEETDPDKTAPVGLIYGPSGCGKSSLVKAGLLPRLSGQVIAVYIEATPNETETRLQNGIRKRCRELPENLGLRDSLAALRQGQVLPEGTKLLVIIDQFEQWLHARRDDENTALVQALRQCDGHRVQCVLMVRDDFWMAATRFMHALEVRLLEGQNSAAVDLFDLVHARKVLASFGRAFGRLSEDGPIRSRDESIFLKEAVFGLAQDGKVVCVRLALFAEMMKGKPWTRATLSEVGGTRGVGLTFLEENFSAATALPEHRLHQKAARAVLKALLPESGTDIKGHMRSYAELLEASGYSSRRAEFDDLIRVLDAELRLITPTDPEGVEGGKDATSKLDAAEKYYQLTHDYLVHSLRDWLTRKERETRRGRARLRLVERSLLWNSKPENRFLPSVWEWANIRLFTSTKDWTEPERAMMRRAGRRHSLIGLAVLGLIALVAWGAFEARGDLQASGIVTSLKTASTAEVPSIIKQLSGSRRWADPQLHRQLRESESSSREYLHASLALLPDDPSQVDYLCGRLLSASSAELPVLRAALLPYQSRVAPKIWSVLSSAKPGEHALLPAAGALAIYAPADPRLAQYRERIAQALVGTNPLYLGLWTESLRPVRSLLTGPLAAIFRDAQRSESERTLAADVLADYAGDDPGLVADLVMDADARAFSTLLAIAERQAATTVPIFLAEIAEPAMPSGNEGGSEDDKDRRAARQARAAVALVCMDRSKHALPLLRHRADPRLRSNLINWLQPLGADLRRLAAELGRLAAVTRPAPASRRRPMDAILFDPETSMQRGLILALGNYGINDVPPELSEQLVISLLDLYQNNPDAGIHGAAEWTLSRWQQQAELRKIDSALMKIGNRPDHRWFLNRQGQTFARIDGPVEFRMGSPPAEPDHLDDELLHRRIIGRRFAIGTKEVTVEQYERFLKENPGVGAANNRRFSPDPRGPVSTPSWYDTAAYCNWLSRMENLPECYEPNPKGKYAEGMRIRADALERMGYRLPTEAEWEYACRAGALSSRYYGVSVSLLSRYGFCILASEGRAWPCGSLEPNDLGLFDILGNVYEWCLDRRSDYKPANDGAIVDLITAAMTVSDTTPHILRGGGFVDVPSHVRSAQRSWNLPFNRLGVYGFRLARTCL